MNLSKFKNIFLVFGVISLISAISTLIAHEPKAYEFLGFPITKSREVLKQTLMALVLFSAYWKQKNK